ncbi:DUF1983 domain-containing protein [Escherichia coli]
MKLPRPRIQKLGDQAVTIQQIQRVQSDTRNELNAMYMLKVQKTENGIPLCGRVLVRGLRMLMVRNAESVFCWQADRIAMITPENGNTTPLFVGAGRISCS